jgi:hypothetical protein
MMKSVVAGFVFAFCLIAEAQAKGIPVTWVADSAELLACLRVVDVPERRAERWCVMPPTTSECRIVTDVRLTHRDLGEAFAVCLAGKSQ